MSSKQKPSNPPHVFIVYDSYKEGRGCIVQLQVGRFLIVSEASKSNQSSACQVTLIHPRVIP